MPMQSKSSICDSGIYFQENSATSITKSASGCADSRRMANDKYWQSEFNSDDNHREQRAEAGGGLPCPASPTTGQSRPDIIHHPTISTEMPAFGLAWKSLGTFVFSRSWMESLKSIERSDLCIHGGAELAAVMI